MKVPSREPGLRSALLTCSDYSAIGNTRPSVPLSDRQLRNKVHKQLSAILAGEQLAATDLVRSHLATTQLATELATEYRAQRSDAPSEGMAIICAGVPGAGKSSALDAAAISEYRRIDPDEIKDILLARLDQSGLLDVRLKHVLADGYPISPGELAGWVHRTSTDAADLVREASIQMRENFIMEGTLSWHDLPASYVDELARGDYERLTILDVEVPMSVAIEQSTQRWWLGRHSGQITHGAPLGGRFIAESLLAPMYSKRSSGNRSVSVCAANARKLHRTANASGIESDLIVISRTATGMQYAAKLTTHGEVRPWEDNQLGAVCTHCGAILKTRPAIRAGVGPDRGHRARRSSS